MYKVRLLLISLCAFLTAFTLRELHLLIEYGKPLNLMAVFPNGHVTPAERALRPDFPYSVIHGGAYNPEELRYSIAKDKIVRAHYADFDLDNTRVVTLAEDRYQYVSYRVKNVVYWTQRKIKIPKGEVLLTDGKHFARTRCGNRLCADLAARNTFIIPPLKQLTLPAFNIDLLPKSQIAFAPPPDIEAGPFAEEAQLPTLAPYTPPATPLPPPPEVWPPVETVPTPVPVLPSFPVVPIPAVTPLPIPPPIAPVPEPSTVYLLLAGFAFTLWLAVRWVKQPQFTEGENRSQP